MMLGYSMVPGRLEKFAGKTLKHAVPQETLAKAGRQVELPRNASKNYVARRWLPFGATAANPNQFFANGTGDRSNAMVQNHLTQEGVTGTPEAIVPMDITVVMQQYDCLYGYTDQVYDMYEDDIPEQMAIQTGERVALVNEMIIWGALRAGTNQFYGGTGTSRATVNGPITLNMLRRMVRSLMANHAKPVTNVLKASANYDTSAVAAGYFWYGHTDLESDIRDLPGFVPVEKYATGQAMPNEIGKVEKIRFITSPEFVSIQDAGAAVGTTGLYSTTGTNIDVYQFILTGADAWSQIALRGKTALSMTNLKPGEKTKSDPHGQRGYYGAIWYKAVMLENDGWLITGNVGNRTLA